jgi:death-on-curing protein
VRYLTLDEALQVAAGVTGLSVSVVAMSARIELLDSALASPQASFGGEEFHPTFESKAAVLCERIARNHPLIDGNKRLAWMCLRLFCDLNEYDFTFTEDDAVNMMLAVAAGEIDAVELREWIAVRVQRRTGDSAK